MPKLNEVTKLKSFLNKLGVFMAPEHPERKDGIGHENEHIKGVMRRAADITDTIEKKYDIGEKIDRNLVTLCAAMHDIGNMSERGMHNHLGKMMVLGRFDAKEAMSGNFECLSKNFATEELKSEALAYISEYGFDLGNIDENLKNKYPVSQIGKDIHKEHRASIADVVVTLANIKAKFDITYGLYESGGKTIISDSNFSSYCKENYNLIPNAHLDGYPEEVKTFKKGLIEKLTKDLLEKAKDRDYRLVVFHKEGLKELMDELREIVPAGSEENKILADCIQDHNVDYADRGKTKRAEARSLYGMIVADADKDNVPETFILRTYAYALNMQVNKFKNGYFIKEAKENGELVPDMDKVAKHILHQACERFHKDGQYKIFDDIVCYKPDPTKIKPVQKVFNDYIDFCNNIRIEMKMPADIESITRVEKYAENYNIQIIKESEEIPESLRGKLLILTKDMGDDLYSQLDNHFGGKDVIALRSDFIQAMQEYADPEKEAENIKKLMPILKEYDMAESIEEAIDKHEAEFYLKSKETEELSEEEIDFIGDITEVDHYAAATDAKQTKAEEKSVENDKAKEIMEFSHIVDELTISEEECI